MAGPGVFCRESAGSANRPLRTALPAQSVRPGTQLPDFKLSVSRASVGQRRFPGFQPARRDKQAVAELGFIVVEVDAMGTPGRSKSFHDTYYGNMGDNGLPDQVSAIRQLAADRPWMDLDRVGIWGHSGGGFASAGAILRYPDFYKVAVSSAGNHDNRNYEDDWGEKWQGLLETYPEPMPGGADTQAQPVLRTNYDSQANQLLAHNLKGKLLLAMACWTITCHRAIRCCWYRL